ncbi:K(+)-transporting ATPase subunit C [Microcella daejeonensis]|uniref:Potassium-transporting ATPase KdpC subunit n=1 Tax=Microcella daejeonensis TaxID=2994971 RepID=A0A9E8MMS2_9MICO|nr:K(+)-transporting ATPase subunit C [Microcella daejeonensis]WAB82377.1 K(+)-transporting ATPase subunit C [Microcella daejeonensis]
MRPLRPWLRSLGTSLRALLVLTLLTGVLYTAAVLGLGQALLPAAANGSLLRDDAGDVIGSRLLGQSFTDAEGAPLPEWFQSRPSAAGDGYDGGASSGSNLGPENPDLIAAIEQRRADIAAFEGVDPSEVPVDALTTSASGLDPHISAAYALLQAPRVAEARDLDPERVVALVESMIEPRALGFIGQERVTVVSLNLALEQLD